MSHQKEIPYFNELKQMAWDISHGKLKREKDTVWDKPHITKEQRKKFSKIDEWKWMKYEGIGPNVNPSGEIAPSGKCKSRWPYKSKNCYQYSDSLHMNQVGICDGEIDCPPLCSSCFYKWREYCDFE
jgi:hypothetical protein